MKYLLLSLLFSVLAPSMSTARQAQVTAAMLEIEHGCPSADIAGLWQNSHGKKEMKPQPLQTFAISQKNCESATLVDMEKNITYKFDLSGAGTTDLPSDYTQLHQISAIRGTLEQAKIRARLFQKSIRLLGSSEIPVLNSYLPIQLAVEAKLASKTPTSQIDEITVKTGGVVIGKSTATGLEAKIFQAISSLLTLILSVSEDTLYRL